MILCLYLSVDFPPIEANTSHGSYEKKTKYGPETINMNTDRLADCQSNDWSDGMCACLLYKFHDQNNVNKTFKVV